MPKDKLYQTICSPVPPFEFDANVARVFNDMIQRSIPFYSEIIRQQVQLIIRYYQPGTRIYDLGCSTGNLGIGLCHKMADAEFELVAVDNSAPMLDVYRQRIDQIPSANGIKLICQDICQTLLENASVVVLNFTLQFLPPAERNSLMARIYHGLHPGGVLLFCEKVTHKQPAMANLQQDVYYAFKRENGYSDLEISQKREALEEVLIPETLEDHLERLQHVGFQTMDVWQKWFNFSALIAVK